MKVFFNRTQLARRLQISAETLRKRIKAGVIRHDAILSARIGRNAELFSEEAVSRFEKLQRKEARR